MKQKRMIVIIAIVALGLLGVYYAFKTGQANAHQKMKTEQKR